MHESRQAGRLIPQENNAPRLRERQAGLNGARVQPHLAQDPAIGLVLGVQNRDLRKKAGAPAERKHAAALSFSNSRRAALPAARRSTSTTPAQSTRRTASGCAAVARCRRSPARTWRPRSWARGGAEPCRFRAARETRSDATRLRTQLPGTAISANTGVLSSARFTLPRGICFQASSNLLAPRDSSVEVRSR